MKVFSKLIAKVEEGGFIRGFKLKGREEEGFQVSHLLFAEDSSYAKIVKTDVALELNHCLCLKINLQKIKIFPVRGIRDIKRAISSFWVPNWKFF